MPSCGAVSSTLALCAGPGLSFSVDGPVMVAGASALSDTVAPWGALTPLNCREILAGTLGSTETNDGGIALALPIYKQYPGIGSTFQVCVTAAAGTWNKLGNFALVLVSIPSTRIYTIQVTGGPATDPDFEIFNATFDFFATTAVAGFEQLIVNLAAGSYVIAVEDFNLSSGSPCFNLSIN